MEEESENKLLDKKEVQKFIDDFIGDRESGPRKTLGEAGKLLQTKINLQQV